MGLGDCIWVTVRVRSGVGLSVTGTGSVRVGIRVRGNGAAWLGVRGTTQHQCRRSTTKPSKLVRGVRIIIQQTRTLTLMRPAPYVAVFGVLY